MAELNTLARPYARAAFEFADQADKLQLWSQSLGMLAAVVNEPKIQALLTNPALTAEAKAESLIELCADEADDQLKNFISVLAENKRLVLLPTILGQYETLKAEREKSVEVHIASAYELSEEQIANLKKALTDRLKREVVLQTETDNKLLGGAYIQANDMVIDASLRGRLAKLAEAMNS
jgi:F-type H+-transporting ATPase subunit delta